ncbi:MAG TPA: efflux RND transporter periplasmic adaptor subunit [Rhodocyclaceae bacterium]|nr:efflux RND transporter periplasmic adaptor subunit [Rhodocyclaceae bacterium]
MVRRVLWGIIALLSVWLGVAYWNFRQGIDSGRQYRTAVVERGTVEETVSAIGALQPSAYVDVGTQVTGQLKILRVAVGQQVNTGDLVAEIDPVLLAAKVDATRATLQSLRAQLTDRMAQLRLAQQQLERNKKLIAGEAVSQELLEQSTAAAEQAAAQVASFRAQVEQAKSELRSDEANLRYTKIFAPMAGTVVSVIARQGQTLVASQLAPTILRVANLGTMTVWAQVAEADVSKLRVGMPVYFNTLGSERRWQSTVRQIMPTPEVVNNVVLYNVLFDVANQDGALKPQMSAQVYLVIARAENALLVPAAALRAAASGQTATSGGRPYRVQVVTEAGNVEDRPITVGLLTRVQAQVLAGLAEGDTIVVGITEGSRRRSKNSG